MTAASRPGNIMGAVPTRWLQAAQAVTAHFTVPKPLSSHSLPPHFVPEKCEKSIQKSNSGTATTNISAFVTRRTLYMLFSSDLQVHTVQCNPASLKRSLRELMISVLEDDLPFAV